MLKEIFKRRRPSTASGVHSANNGAEIDGPVLVDKLTGKKVTADFVRPNSIAAGGGETGEADAGKRVVALQALDFTLADPKRQRRFAWDQLASPDTPCSYSSFAERLNLFLHAESGDAGEDVSMPSDFLPNNISALTRRTAGDGDEGRYAGMAYAGQGLSYRVSSLGQRPARPKEDKSTKDTWKKRAKIVLPHVGLVLMSILYTLLGAVIFYAIERPYEVDQKKQSLDNIQNFKKRFAYEMWALSQNSNHIDETSWTKMVDEQLEEFMRTLQVAFTNHHVTMDDIVSNLTEHTAKWSFSASLFFSATVITTIGYGHLVPQTDTGQIICIIFALIGIPLILVTIADMGKFLSVYVIKIYQYYAKFTNFLHLHCARFIRRMQKRRVTFMAGRRMKNVTGRFGSTSAGANGDANRNPEGGPDNESRQVPGTSAAAAGEEDSSMDRLEAASNVEETISATFLLFILVGYTALGAALLPLWEKGKEWTYFGAFYYCFVTVTTIGFGDIVPENQTFILATITYIVLGLIITTMCIDLVGSTYIRDLHFFGRNVKQMLFARQGLIQFGGKVVNLSDVFGYVAFLQRNFGVTAEQIGQMATLPDEYLLACLVHGRQPNIRYFAGTNPFIPNDIYYIKWIEQPRTLSYTSEKVLASLESLDVTSRCSTVRTPREWYYHMIMEHMKDTKV